MNRVTTETLIRTANQSDLPDVVQCARDAYNMYVSRIGREPAPMVADFESQINAGILYVLVYGDQITGFIVFYPRKDHVHIENVALNPGFQGQGYGKMLINFAEGRALQNGFRTIELYTNAKMTENLGLYPRLGYEETGRGQEDGFDRVFYRKVLTH